MHVRQQTAQRLAVAVFTAMIAVGSTPANAGVFRCRQCSPCCPAHCPTTYRVGADPDDLKIRVVGAQFNKLELYFRDEVRTETIGPAANLHCSHRIVTALESEFGAFAVRYGKSDDTVRLFAWKKGGAGGAVTLAPAPAITLKPTTTICIEWITTRTARLFTKGSASASLIVRFSDAEVAWQKFDEASQSWLPIN